MGKGIKGIKEIIEALKSLFDSNSIEESDFLVLSPDLTRVWDKIEKKAATIGRPICEPEGRKKDPRFKAIINPQLEADMRKRAGVVNKGNDDKARMDREIAE